MQNFQSIGWTPFNPCTQNTVESNLKVEKKEEEEIKKRQK